MDLRIGPSGRCSGQVIETSAFARFSEMFDFGLLQQYLPGAEIPLANFVALNRSLMA
jgi:hypothetical protein